MSERLENVTGGCYCGNVRYLARQTSASVVECHCSQCRKQAGHRYASTITRRGDVDIDGESHITWFRASDEAERGFCATCGSHLFWRSLRDDSLAILAATVDEPTGLMVVRHIFVADKGDYYDITDALPQFEGYDTPVPSG